MQHPLFAPHRAYSAFGVVHLHCFAKEEEEEEEKEHIETFDRK